jgi:hypothetical protein
MATYGLADYCSVGAIWRVACFANTCCVLRLCVASRVVACCVLRHVAPTEPKCCTFVIHRDLQLIEDVHGHEPATSLSQVRGLGYHQCGICHGATYPPRSSVGATATMCQMPQSGSIWPSGSIWLPHLPHLHSGSVWPSRRLVCFAMAQNRALVAHFP